MNPIRVTVLGASGPYPGSDDLPSILISFGKLSILLDAGEGVQHRLQYVGSSVASINCILITHLHGDHVLGLIPLLQSRSLSGTEKPVTILGPPGLEEYLLSNFKLLFFKPRYEVILQEVRGGETIELSSNVTVNVLKLDHLLPTVGYVITFNNSRKISYVTDTRPLTSYIDGIRGSDLLIHDSTFSVKDKELANEYGHSTAVDAARVAHCSEAKILLLFHISPRYRSLKTQLLHEARQYFRNSWVAERFMKVLIK